MTTVCLNGSSRTVSARTVADLPGELGLAAETLLIEHNGKALLRSEWTETSLSDGDRLEFLRVAAGG